MTLRVLIHFLLLKLKDLYQQVNEKGIKDPINVQLSKSQLVVLFSNINS